MIQSGDTDLLTQVISDSVWWNLNKQKCDAQLLSTLDACNEAEKVDVFIHFKNAPDEKVLSDQGLSGLKILGVNGKRKVLSASLSVSEISIVSDTDSVLGIMKSTTKYIA